MKRLAQSITDRTTSASEALAERLFPYWTVMWVLVLLAAAVVAYAWPGSVTGSIAGNVFAAILVAPGVIFLIERALARRAALLEERRRAPRDFALSESVRSELSFIGMRLFATRLDVLPNDLDLKWLEGGHPLQVFSASWHLDGRRVRASLEEIAWDAADELSRVASERLDWLQTIWLAGQDSLPPEVVAAVHDVVYHLRRAEDRLAAGRFVIDRAVEPNHQQQRRKLFARQVGLELSLCAEALARGYAALPPEPPTAAPTR